MSNNDPKRQRVLDASFSTFTRFGFKKTSMDAVARAADLSRQGLYLHFATKEDLFGATVAHSLGTALAAARTHLSHNSGPIEPRLVGAFDEWLGRYVGLLGGDTSDLFQASHALLGPLIAQHETDFTEALAKALRAAGVLEAYKSAGLTARQLAATLYATARGLKHGANSRATFAVEITLAVRVFCTPLRGSR